MKSLVKQLQRLDWLLIDAKADSRYNHPKNQLIKIIVDYYQEFFTLAPQHKAEEQPTRSRFCCTLFSPRPRKLPNLLEQRIQEIKSMFDLIHTVAFDQESEETAINVVAHLSIADKIKLFKILGHSYSQDQLEEENTKRLMTNMV